MGEQQVAQLPPLLLLPSRFDSCWNYLSATRGDSCSTKCRRTAKTKQSVVVWREIIRKSRLISSNSIKVLRLSGTFGVEVEWKLFERKKQQEENSFRNKKSGEQGDWKVCIRICSAYSETSFNVCSNNKTNFPPRCLCCRVHRAKFTTKFFRCRFLISVHWAKFAFKGVRCFHSGRSTEICNSL